MIDFEELFYKALFKGDLKGAASVFRNFLKKKNSKYLDIFDNYFDMLYNFSRIFRPEENLDYFYIMRQAIIKVLKYAYRERDIKTAKDIKQFVHIMDFFEVEDDIP